MLHTHTDDLLTTDIDVSVLQSINRKVDLIVTLHSKMKDLQASLNFAHSQIKDIQKENDTLHTQKIYSKLSFTLSSESNQNITSHCVHRIVNCSDKKDPDPSSQNWNITNIKTS